MNNKPNILPLLRELSQNGSKEDIIGKEVPKNPINDPLEFAEAIIGKRWTDWDDRERNVALAIAMQMRDK